jgi:hypothetical protein
MLVSLDLANCDVQNLISKALLFVTINTSCRVIKPILFFIGEICLPYTSFILAKMIPIHKLNFTLFKTEFFFEKIFC